MSAIATQSFNNREIDAQRGVTAKRLLRLPEVMSRVGLKRSTIYKRMSDGSFPRSRSLGPKCAVWIEDEIDAWIASVIMR